MIPFLKKHLVIIVICIFSLCTNLINIDGYSLYLDELISLDISTGIGFHDASDFLYNPRIFHNQVFHPSDYWEKTSMSSVLKSDLNDDSGNGFIYEATLHFWFNTFGVSMFTGRLLSVLLSIFTLLFTYLIIRILFSNIAIAYLSCFLLSIHPLFLHYSHVIRPYSMALCFSTISVYFFLIILRNNNAKMLLLNYFAFAITVTIAILSHYLTFYIFVFFAFYILFFYRKLYFKIKQHLIGAIITIFIAGGILYCWMYIFGGNEGMKLMTYLDKNILINSSIQTHTSSHSIVEGIIQQLLGILGNYFQYLGFRIREFGFLLLVPILIIALNFKSLISITEKKNIFFLTVIVLSSLINATILSIQHGHTSSFHIRYSIFVIPFAMILIAACVITAYTLSQNKIKKTATLVLFGIYLLICIPSAIPAYTGICSAYNDDPELRNHILKFELIPYKHEIFETISSKIKKEYNAGDTVYYQNECVARGVNLFLKNYPEVIQKIDSLQGKQIIQFHHQTNEKTILFDYKDDNGYLYLSR